MAPPPTGHPRSGAAPRRRRRVAQDVLDAELVQGPADLGEACAVRGAARGRGVHGPAGAVGVQGLGQAVLLEDGPEGSHDDGATLALVGQLGVQQALKLN
jgi:hypothetical protein